MNPPSPESLSAHPQPINGDDFFERTGKIYEQALGRRGGGGGGVQKSKELKDYGRQTGRGMWTPSTAHSHGLGENEDSIFDRKFQDMIDWLNKYCEYISLTLTAART
jgi:hypothetical protein